MRIILIEAINRLWWSGAYAVGYNLIDKMLLLNIHHLVSMKIWNFIDVSWMWVTGNNQQSISQACKSEGYWLIEKVWIEI